MDHPALSVIIPVYREELRINALLAHVASLPALGGVEVLVVDGDPEQRTLAVLDLDMAIPVASDKGRARQMNAGAAVAQGDMLLFLHADTRLPVDAFQLIHSALAGQTFCGGAFSLSIQPEVGLPRSGLRFIAWAANLRSRVTRAPYGDQAIFIRRDCFVPLGGFSDIPLMEDLEFMTRLRRRGLPIAILRARVVTSARRWEKEGLLHCTGRNLLLRALYHLGVPAHRLVGFYP
ncbi:MAG: hypothetical protein A2051_07545 [Desulfovibrionales bacterium GWA2_65_9]|nr:MAG: hypothetical protein A2051_07545 [Desulfovibrionales bacterium GWA2_65_9]